MPSRRRSAAALPTSGRSPHSQIYAETGRLAGLALLAEERQHTGRRRRSYRITGEGRAALGAWLAEPTDEPPQFRSLGLLKLFFSQHAEPEDVAELARTQVALHRQYRRARRRGSSTASRPGATGRASSPWPS